ncbi:unnamed protein product, partial [Porites lobata]
SVPFTLDRAISRIQKVYDFDCRCLNQVKPFIGTTAQTQGPQDTVSTVVLMDEKRILQALKEIKDLLSQHVPQLLQEFEVKITQPFDFGNIGEVQGETTETAVTARGERGRKERSSALVQSSGDIVYPASDASSCEIKLYVLQQDVIKPLLPKKQGECALMPMCPIR